MSFIANVKKISKLLNDAIYIIPRNQREYIWKDDNWNDLLEDVKFSTQSNTPHFIGSVVLQKGDEENGLETFRIIDGQQRMITITVFMLAIMMQLKQSNHVNDFDGMLKYVEATDKKNVKHMVLSLDQYESIEMMLKIMKEESGEALSKMSLTAFSNRCNIRPSRDKQILDCYKFFYTAIHTEYEKTKDVNTILQLKDTLLGMSYVHIVADTEEDSYTVFEILNARGTDLEDAELLKNYIMRYIQPERDRDRVKSIWQNMELILGSQIKSFIKHYAVHYYSTEKQELRQNPYKNIRLNCRREDVKKLLLDISQKANYYCKIAFPSNCNAVGECSETEKRVFSFFKSSRQEQVRPLLLSLMHQHALEKMSDNEYNQMLIFLYRFIICYTVIGEEKSNKIRDIIYKYAPMIENEYSSNIIVSLKTELQEKIPNENFFVTAFQNLGYSKHFPIFATEAKKRRVKIVLKLLEEYWGNNSTDLDFTIEHILPDAQSEENARIGNLLPLEERLNDRCGEKPLREKIIIYEESMLLSVRKFLEIRKKKPDFDLEDRTQRLAHLFYTEILKK